MFHARSLARPFRAVALGSLLLTGVAWTPAAALAASSSNSPGAVFTATNDSSGNTVLEFPRHADGTLDPTPLAFPTGGRGTGAFLDSQGSIILSSDKQYLFVVNAGSSTVSSFRIVGNALQLVDTVSSGGIDPVSLTYAKHLLYVANNNLPQVVPSGVYNDGPTTIQGFYVGSGGALTPIPGSNQPTGGVGPREIGFNNNGKVLAVSERSSTDVATFTVDGHGVPTLATVFPDTVAGGGQYAPFGFEFTHNGNLLLADSHFSPALVPSNPIGGAQSFDVSNQGALSVISPYTPNGQVLTCWMQITPNDKYAYTTNPAGPGTFVGTVSEYAVGNQGSLTLVNGAAGIVEDPTHPLITDEHLSQNGHYLYALSIDNPPEGAPETGGLSSYAVNSDGSLAPLGGFPITYPGSGFSGLAAD